MKTTLQTSWTPSCIFALVVLTWLFQFQPANAVDILFHGRTATAGNSDTDVIAHLNARYGAGSVDYVDLDGVVLPAGQTGAGYDLIVLSESISSSSVRDGAYTNTPVPVINWENALPHITDGRFQMTEGKGTVDATEITIENPASPLAAGLSGTVTMFTAGAEKLQYGKGAVCDGCDLVASIAAPDDIGGDNVGNAIFAVDTGGMLLGDDFLDGDGNNIAPMIAPARRVMFPMWNNSFPFLTSDGIKLFDASIDWLLDIQPGGDTGPGDFAGDGIVEGADLTLLLDFWNKPAGTAWVTDRPSPEGANVAGDELTALLDNWNTNYLSGSFAAATIPEPSTLAIALLASIVGLATRRVG